MKSIFFIGAILLYNSVFGQSHGKIVINSQVNQPIMVSLNGVRISNQYIMKSVFEYADENDYRARIWVQGLNYPVNFNLQSSVGYETVYSLSKDQYGAYNISLISKVLMSSQPVTSPTTTPVITPTVQVIKEMTQTDFNERYNTVKNESFDDSKLEKARFVFDKEYFSSDQAAKVTKLFSFENKKVEFAKFAYKRTIDKNNYYKVVDALTFDSYKKELQEWIKKNP